MIEASRSVRLRLRQTRSAAGWADLRPPLALPQCSIEPAAKVWPCVAHQSGDHRLRLFHQSELRRRKGARFFLAHQRQNHRDAILQHDEKADLLGKAGLCVIAPKIFAGEKAIRSEFAHAPHTGFWLPRGVVERIKQKWPGLIKADKDDMLIRSERAVEIERSLLLPDRQRPRHNRTQPAPSSMSGKCRLPLRRLFRPRRSSGRSF